MAAPTETFSIQAVQVRIDWNTLDSDEFAKEIIDQKLLTEKQSLM